MPEQIPLMVDAATQELRQFASDETIPRGQLLAALQVALTGIVTSNVSGVLASDTILQALGKLQAQASNKVDKVAGKQLSTEDFTSDERDKLANIAEQATKNATDAALRDRATHTGTQLMSTISDAGTAATRNIQTDAVDGAPGSLLTVGSFGLGGMCDFRSSDFHGNLPPEAFYGRGAMFGLSDGGAGPAINSLKIPGLPAYTYGVLFIQGQYSDASASSALQRWFYTRDRFFVSVAIDASTWSAWRELMHTGNIGDASVSYAASSGSANTATSAGTATSAASATTAGSAATLTTARTINGTSFNGSANITTANWGASRNLTVGNAAKAVNGSENVAWSLAEIGAFPAANVVGTMGGGAIIERGSNANGEYVKFADGTQICTIASIAVVFANGANILADWSFPAAFSAAPFAACNMLTPDLAVAKNLVTVAYGVSGVQARLSVLSVGQFVASDATGLLLQGVAIGRWK